MPSEQFFWISHDDCLRHDMSPNHPECPARLKAIDQHLRDTGLFNDCAARLTAQPATDADLLRAHSAAHVQAIAAMAPASGTAWIDGDTAMCPHSLNAARLAAGSLLQAVDRVMSGDGARGFCAVRPPGHHAEHGDAMGFCLFNSVAVAARYAQVKHGLSRVSVLDFDVHHGNGTVDIFADDPSVMVCSSYQHPFYPGRQNHVARDHIVHTRLAAGTGSDAFRRAIEADWLPALARFKPELILVSAGFDAHVEDPLGGLSLQDEDYAWLGQTITELSAHYAQGRVVSVLEGGYHLQALARSVQAYCAPQL